MTAHQTKVFLSETQQGNTWEGCLLIILTGLKLQLQLHQQSLATCILPLCLTPQN